MAEKGVEEQVLAMERLQLFCAYNISISYAPFHTKKG